MDYTKHSCLLTNKISEAISFPSYKEAEEELYGIDNTHLEIVGNIDYKKIPNFN